MPNNRHPDFLIDSVAAPIGNPRIKQPIFPPASFFLTSSHCIECATTAQLFISVS